MKITEFGSIKSAGDVKKRSSVSAAKGFAELLDAQELSDTTPSLPVSDVAATAALDNLLAMQEISQEDIQRKKLVQQGNNLLNSLENIQKQLLMGTMPLSALQDLTRQLSIKKQFVSDPHLNALIDDIELRAAIELAKLQMATRPIV